VNASTSPIRCRFVGGFAAQHPYSGREDRRRAQLLEFSAARRDEPASSTVCRDAAWKARVVSARQVFDALPYHAGLSATRGSANQTVPARRRRRGGWRRSRRMVIDKPDCG